MATIEKNANTAANRIDTIKWVHVRRPSGFVALPVHATRNPKGISGRMHTNPVRTADAFSTLSEKPPCDTNTLKTNVNTTMASVPLKTYGKTRVRRSGLCIVRKISTRARDACHARPKTSARPGRCTIPAARLGEGQPLSQRRIAVFGYFRSKRSRFMTLFHAPMKSLTNFSLASSHA
jgi:hypothetical protein